MGRAGEQTGRPCAHWGIDLFIEEGAYTTVASAVAMLMVLVYNLADTFFIGQTRDALQVAAVSLATPVFLLFMAVGTAFGVDGTSVISRALGEGKREYARKVCSFCMWGCAVVGIVMTVLFLLCMDPILSLIGASTDTWDLAKIYLSIVAYSGPFVLISNCSRESLYLWTALKMVTTCFSVGRGTGPTTFFAPCS